MIRVYYMKKNRISLKGNERTAAKKTQRKHEKAEAMTSVTTHIFGLQSVWHYEKNALLATGPAFCHAVQSTLRILLRSWTTAHPITTPDVAAEPGNTGLQCQILGRWRQKDGKFKVFWLESKLKASLCSLGIPVTE